LRQRLFTAQYKLDLKSNRFNFIATSPLSNFACDNYIPASYFRHFMKASLKSLYILIPVTGEDVVITPHVPYVLNIEMLRLLHRKFLL
jgi:hypothetical protein